MLIGTGTEDPPSVLTAPTIPNGAAPMMGQRLDAARGRWTNQPTSYAFQWVRCNADGVTGCTDLAGATRNRYVPGAADVGGTLVVRVVAHNQFGDSAPAASAPTGVVQPSVPVLRTAPMVPAGTPRVGVKIGGRAGAWYAGPTGYRYQWLRCDAAGDNCVAAAAERTSTRDVNPYVPTALDAGGTLRLRVVAVNQFGDSAPATTAPTGVVAHTAPEMLVAPRVPSGSPQVGVKVAGRSGSWTDLPTSYRYQWLRCDAAGDNCVAAAAERTSTRDFNNYVPTALDATRTLRLRVVAVNELGESAPATTAPTGVVDGGT
ncbi:hypothetical protein [Capillimicrobium parvum]|uniref:hypothetical protein n=1 Tax=Capillimicrobium parvum TaxID=2884022 RepID=UPI00216B12BB|nr:hypothetical protein [Capillimicrobium parvum]